MDRIDESYRDTVKRLIRERERLAAPFIPTGLELACLFDDASAFYALFSVGWMQGERVCGPVLLVRLKDNKIWVEKDDTDAAIAEDLVESGVPRADIVLGFQPPEMRQYTQFATA